MKKLTTNLSIALLTLMTWQLPNPVVAAETFSLNDVLERVAANYADIRIAAMQVDKARQDIRSVQSSLGWNLSAMASTGSQPGIGGATIDQTQATLGFNKQNLMGHNLSIGTAYNSDDGIPGFTLPSDTLSLDLSYRIPLGQGRGNAQYQKSMTGAEANAQISEANLYLLRDNIARNLLELYFGASQTYNNLLNAQAGLERAKRLLAYEEKNRRLGLAEQRDVMNREAALHAAEVQLYSLQAIWNQQRTSLNRLMGRPWNAEFIPDGTTRTPQSNFGQREKLEQEILTYDPQLKIFEAQLRIAEAEVTLQKDQSRNRLDLVVGAGVRDNSNLGADTTYNLSIEFNRPVSKDGFDARLYQAQLDKDIAETRLKAGRSELQYTLYSLLQEIHRQQQAVISSAQRLQATESRYRDVQQRYKQGRATIAELLMAETELEANQFAHLQQKIELSRRAATLNLMRGQLWSAKGE